MSARMENSTKEYDHKPDDPNVAMAVRWATADTITAKARPEVLEYYARQQVESIDDLEQSVENALGNIVTPNVELTLDEPSEFGVLVNHLGAYPVWNLPTKELSAPKLDDTSNRFEHMHQSVETTNYHPLPVRDI